MKPVYARIVRILLLLFISPLLAATAPLQAAMASPCVFSGGTLTSDTTLTTLCGTYDVQSSITVPNNITLTIQPGVTLAFPLGEFLDVQAGGTLIADASSSPSTPIVFTTVSSSTNPGQWSGVFLDYNSIATLKDATIQYAGNFNPVFSGDINLLMRTNATIDHVTVSNGGADGIDVYGGAPTITNSTVSSNVVDGIFVNTGATSGAPTTISNLTATGNGNAGVEVRTGCADVTNASLNNNAGYAMLLNLDSVCDVGLSGLTATGNGNGNRIGVSGGNLTGHRTLPAAGLDYIAQTTIGSNIIVGNSGTLTIHLGVTLNFPLGAFLQVYGGGTLIADASASPTTPIVFTTVSALPAPGQWQGLFLSSNSSAVLKYAVVEYAGYNGHVLSVNASPTLDHVSLLNNSGAGLDVEAAVNVTATYTNFENSPGGSGITNNGGTIDARNSYWNSSSGPTIAGNPAGAGDAIVGNTATKVNFGGFTCAPVTPTSATPCNSTVGGANLTLTLKSANTVMLGWSMVGIQAGYDVLRLTPSGESVLPPPLPTTAASFTDTAPPATYDLYAVLPVASGGAALGVSDLLGYLPNLQTSTGAPTNFAVALDQSPTATLTWTAPGGQTGYTLYAIPANGAAQRTQTLPATATSATDNTGGVPTIYVLAALSGQNLLGNTNGLIVFPGIATVHPLAAARAAQKAAPAALATQQALIRAKVQAAQTWLGHRNWQVTIKRLLRS